jgi:alkylhydroperoxidase family enzyme
MGHSEMLLAVAGVKTEEVKDLTRKLADGDWSDFPNAERAAFSLAYKVTREPDKVSDADRDALFGVFGRERSTDLVWYISWCNFMTRFADAFQLPLERTNVFAPPKKDEKKESKNQEKKEPPKKRKIDEHQ